MALLYLEPIIYLITGRTHSHYPWVESKLPHNTNTDSIREKTQLNEIKNKYPMLKKWEDMFSIDVSNMKYETLDMIDQTANVIEQSLLIIYLFVKSTPAFGVVCFLQLVLFNPSFFL